MSRSRITTVLVGLTLVLAGGATTLDAQEIVPSTAQYVFTGIASSTAEACAEAQEILDDSCPLHGAVVVKPAGCQELYGPFGEYLGDVCFCKARTNSCWDPFTP